MLFSSKEGFSKGADCRPIGNWCQASFEKNLEMEEPACLFSQCAEFGYFDRVCAS